MSRASQLFTIFLLVLAASSEVQAQRVPADVRFKKGNIQVRRNMQSFEDEDGKQRLLPEFTITRDGIHFGLSYEDAKVRRMPGTYYHTQGPFGIVMRRFDWFPGKANTFHADARLPAALVALGGCDLGLASLPVSQFVALWSEPAVAVIGMNAGTAAAYARPFQVVDFYEPSQDLIDLHERQGKDIFFHAIPDAKARGANIRVFHGKPRKMLEQRLERKTRYQVILMEACSGEDCEKIFVDLFTKEGIERCMNRLDDEGVLCVHTSHRFVNLPPVLAAIAGDLKLHVRRGHDQAPGARGFPRRFADMDHFSSEWVLLSRNEHVLNAICKAPPNYEQRVKEDNFGGGDLDYWSTPKPHDHVWTDKGPNLLHGILRGHPATMGYERMIRPGAEFIGDMARNFGASSRTQFAILDLSRMPQPMQDWYVQWQLKNHPGVNELWPPSP